jgi:DNA helicase IV
LRTDSLIADTLTAAEQLRSATGGSVAVIAPLRLLESLTELADGTPLVILDAVGVKGLEFDGVVVTEPAEIAAETGGLAALYIAVTRTTNRLAIVHSRPLPAALDRRRRLRV